MARYREIYAADFCQRLKGGGHVSQARYHVGVKFETIAARRHNCGYIGGAAMIIK